MNWLDLLLADPTMEALCAGLPPDDARNLREERAGILEHEAGMSRDDAERLAGLRRSLLASLSSQRPAPIPFHRRARVSSQRAHSEVDHMAPPRGFLNFSLVSPLR